MLLSYKPLHLEAQQRLQEEGCVVDIKADMGRMPDTPPTEDADGLSQATLQPNNKESLVSPTHPVQW